MRVKQGLIFWALGIVGTFAGSRIAPAIPEVMLVVGFALVMVGAAIAMWRKSRSVEPTTAPHRAPWLLPVVAISVGVLTGLFGVGGGFLIVPALVLVFGLPFGLATGTSLLVVALTSTTALLFKFDSWSTVDWRIPGLVTIGGLVGSVIASRGSAHVPRRLLERIFAVFLVLLSVGMLIQVTVIAG